MNMCIYLIVIMMLLCEHTYAQTTEKVKSTSIGNISVKLGIDKGCINSYSIFVNDTVVKLPNKMKQICGFKDIYIKEENEMPYIEIRFKNKKTLFYIAETGIWASYQGIAINKKVDPLE